MPHVAQYFQGCNVVLGVYTPFSLVASYKVTVQCIAKSAEIFAL